MDNLAPFRGGVCEFSQNLSLVGRRWVAFDALDFVTPDWIFGGNFAIGFGGSSRHFEVNVGANFLGSGMKRMLLVTLILSSVAGLAEYTQPILPSMPLPMAPTVAPAYRPESLANMDHTVSYDRDRRQSELLRAQGERDNAPTNREIWDMNARFRNAPVAPPIKQK